MSIPVYVEAGRRRCFAGAVDWPGWCRSARDEPSALEALAAYLPRYGRVLARAPRRVGRPPKDATLEVVERLTGDASTDFGTPAGVPELDRRPLEGAELARQTAVLRACWDTFDAVVDQAQGRALATGPRGGGRPLEGIVAHVRDGERAYVARVGGRVPPGAGLAEQHQAALEAIEARADGLLPETGPRGGLRWPARYALRRAAWHVLDHAWEIEDRTG